MADITMPRLSDTMSEGAVGRWLKKPGDKVQRDEVIAEIETDKATMDLVSFEDGTLQEIRVPEGKIVPIGEVIGVIGDGSAVAASAPPQAKATDAKAAEAKPATNGTAQPQAKPAAASAGAGAAGAGQAGAGQAGADAVAQPVAASAGAGAAAGAQASAGAAAGAQATGTAGAAAANGERVKASPVARRIAEEQGVDLRSVPGTGPGGRILKANVEEFRRRGLAPQPAGGAAQTQQAKAGGAPAPASAPTLVKGEVTPLSRIRRAVARAMTESKPGVPHIYLTAEIDMAAAMALRKQINESGVVDPPISPNDLIVKAAARALQKHPLLNASYAQTADGHPGMILHPQINVSVAVATENGLLAPVVKDADKKGLGQIAAEVRELAARARDGSIKQPDLEGATFQTSNLGMFGIVEFVSIVTTPLTASLAIGAIRQVPVVVDGAVTVGQRLNVTLSADHRVADGAAAAQYLQELTKLLQAPISLLV